MSLEPTRPLPYPLTCRERASAAHTISHTTSRKTFRNVGCLATAGMLIAFSVLPVASVGCSAASDADARDASRGPRAPEGGDRSPGAGDGPTALPSDLESVQPSPVCPSPIALVDTSRPTAVVGNGSAESCTEEALERALEQGGVITFACGEAPFTFPLTRTKRIALRKDTVLDGGGKITLDGRSAVRILEYAGTDYRKGANVVTLQRLRFVNGKAPGGGYVAPNPDNPACAYGFRDGSGGAVLVRDVKLHVIDCTFEGNEAASPGPDVGGGAIYALGSLDVTVVGSAFRNNRGSNGGAVGLLQSNGTFVNDTFLGNEATGTGANYGGGKAEGCPGVGHPNQGGAGGNAGALYADGSDDTDFVLCGTVLGANRASELGGAFFRTANRSPRKTRIERTTFDRNTSRSAGALYLRNAKPLEIVASTFSGNSADGGGVGQVDECTLDVVNTTFFGNEARRGLGGALANYFGTTGTFRNVTFANNRSEGGSGLFSAAIAGQMNFEMFNTVFAQNLTKDAGAPMACGQGQARGANNFQWPQKKVVGGGDDAACVSGIRFEDPRLLDLADNGGPTRTVMPSPGSVVVGAGRDCPEVDQRGRPRNTAACTAGAVEP